MDASAVGAQRLPDTPRHPPTKPYTCGSSQRRSQALISLS
jgi:hypothetical protein